MPTCRVLASKHRFRIFADSLDPCTRISQLLEAWRRTPGQNSQLLFQRTQYSKLRYVNHINQSKLFYKSQQTPPFWNLANISSGLHHVGTCGTWHLGLNWTWVGFPTKSTQQTPSLLNIQQKKRNKHRHVLEKKMPGNLLEVFPTRARLRENHAGKAACCNLGHFSGICRWERLNPMNTSS